MSTGLRPDAFEPDVGPVEHEADINCEFIGTCDRDAVYRVAVGGLGRDEAYCPFHLACWRFLHPEKAQRYDDLTVVENLSDYLPERAHTSLEDLPPWLSRRGRQVSRIGLDHHGHAHYYGRDDENRLIILVLDEQLELVDQENEEKPTLARYPSNIRCGHALEHWLNQINSLIGWIQVDPHVTDQRPERDAQ
ncbi:hypothetical protein [Haladaptatus sp. CMSO5]|uniref:hypothetical protein n=1 Tax=Haladaptatus sp. CMSO5 TaxID=3120514 RepID=UPI002FCE4859